MAEMTDAQFRQKVIDVLDEKGASVDTDIEQVTEIDDKVTLPGIKSDAQGNFVSYVLARMTVFHQYVKDATDVIVATWNGWFGADDTAGVQKQWKDLRTDAVAATNAANTAAEGVEAAIATAAADHTRAESDHSTASSDHTRAQSDHTTASSDHSQASTDHSTASADHTQASSDHTRAESDHSTASSDHTRAESDHTRAETDHSTASTDHTTAVSDHTAAISDHTQASADHTASVAATNEACNVNADLTGMTVTITDRNGVSTSVNIGFEIKPEHVYPSYAAMVADTSSTRPVAGEFCMIATTDPTSLENARLYSKNSSGGFTFLSDLDQASSSAWADWMDNYKPVIESDHSRAESDHSTASSDHTQAESDTTRAGTDHTTATTDHTTAQSDHTRAESDHSTAASDHTTAQSDHTIAEDDHDRADTDHTTASDDHDTASTDHTQAVSDHSRAETDHSTAVSDHSTAESDHSQALDDTGQAATDHSRAENDHSTAVSDSTQAGTDHSTATSDHTRAENDHTQATTDTGVASADHTRAENDHSTASTDHTTAVSDHTIAGTDHTRAESDHTTATNDHTQAGTDHTESVTATQYANEQGDYAKDWNDHPPFIGDGTTGDLNYWYIYDITTEQYVRSAYAKGDNLDWDDMTPEEKQRLIDEVLQSLEDFGFDAVPTEGSTKPVRSGGIYNAIQDEATRAQTAEQANATDIGTINGKIPTEATTSNQLSDKAWVTAAIGVETTRASGAEATLQQNIDTEASTRQSADTTLQTNIDNEATARSGADTTLQNNIDAEETRAKAAEQANADDIDAIEALIPSAATTSNQLADKAFVNSSIATATATFRGSYNLVSDLNLTVSATESQISTALGTTISTADNNDYCFVQVPTSDSTPTEVARIDRYKHNGTAWAFEYSLNNSGFTASQWEAINSTITSGLVAKLTALPTNAELTALLDAKQDNLTFASDATCESIIDELV